MKILISKKAYKEISKLSLKMQEVTANVLEEIIESENIEQVVNAKKMRGHSSAYKIWLSGEYRMGLFVKDNIAYITTVKLRSTIYNTFP